jgi:hypothetical protein
MDSVISQLDPIISAATHSIPESNERNALLKYFALNHVFDTDTPSIYNEQLTGFGQYIFEKERVYRTIHSYFHHPSSHNRFCKNSSTRISKSFI